MRHRARKRTPGNVSRVREPIALPWAVGETLSLPLPPAWRVVVQSDLHPPPALADLPSAVGAALAAPIGLPPLRDLVQPGSRITLVMDDPGRPTPVHRLAPIVLEHLLAAGARAENITGLFAIGAHREMTPAEMEARAGAAVAGQVACQSVDCHTPEAFAYQGQTRRGTPVWLHRIAVEADLRILIGTIEPHPQAGFGGGYKNLLPGLAGAASIGHNHLLMPSPDRYNMIGTRPDENPMRLDLEEAGRMVAGPTFLLNVVLDPALDPVAVVAGDAVAAHRAGVEISRRIYGVPLSRPVDVVLSSAYPMNQDLRQAGKGVLNVAGACRPGGVIVGFLHCEHGVENVLQPPFVPPLGLLRALVTLLGARGIAALVRRLPAQVPVEARFLVNLALQMLREYRVLVYAPRLTAALGRRLGAIVYDEVEPLLAASERLARRPDPAVAIFHHGGVSFPVPGRPAKEVSH